MDLNRLAPSKVNSKAKRLLHSWRQKKGSASQDTLPNHESDGTSDFPHGAYPNLPEKFLANISIENQDRDKDHFVYQPLDLKKDEIRLLQLLPAQDGDDMASEVACSIIHVSLKNAPDYEAISYTWGDQSDLRQILLNGRPFTIGHNLEMGLRRFRTQSANKLFWADAICIDQSNDSERSEQVVKMRNIYEKAALVRVWLGEEESDTVLAFEILRTLAACLRKGSGLLGLLSDPGNGDHFMALHTLFTHKYWWRVWVVQEVNSAKRIMIYCGENNIPWQDVVDAQNTLRTFEDDLLTLCRRSRRPEASDKVVFSITTWGPYHLRPPRTSAPGTLPTMGQVLMRYRSKIATDPRDNVYALIGLSDARNHAEVQIDYSKSVRQVYAEITQFVILSSLKLNIICARPKDHTVVQAPTSDKSLNLPSWAPNWALRVKVSSLHGGDMDSVSFHAAGDTKAKVRFDISRGIMFAEGFCIGRVSKAYEVPQMNGTFDDMSAFAMVCKWHDQIFQDLSTPAPSQAEFCRSLVCKVCGNQYAATVFAFLIKWYAEKSSNTISELMQRHEAAYQYRSEDDWAVTPAASAWSRIIAQNIFRRRLFRVGSTIGLGPEAMEEGDVVCILLGCDLPVLLRKVGTHYIYHGEVYIDSYMHGEAMMERSWGFSSMQEFEIQ